LYVGNTDLKKGLGEIEEQIVNILQNYHEKMQSKKQDDGDSNLSHDIHTTNIISSKTDAGSSSVFPSHSNSYSSSASRTQQENAMSMLTTEEEPARTIHQLFGSPHPFNIQDFASTPSSPIRQDLTNPFATQNNSISNKESEFKNFAVFISKDQPFRYTGLRPPHLSTEELKRKDGAEEEYPLTYDELKHKVWRKANGRKQSTSMELS
jgi:hypothetical protein